MATGLRLERRGQPPEEDDMSPISIIGSGGIAAAVGGLAANAGHAVEIISRDPARAEALAKRIGGGATAGVFGAVPAGDLVLLAIPYSFVLGAVEQYGQALGGKILVDPTNPVATDLKSFVTPADTFGAQEIVRTAPADAIVIKAFNNQFSHILAAGPVEGRPLDVPLAGDDAAAKAPVSAFIVSLGLRPLDVGPLPMARTLENFCLLSLGLMTHAVKNTNFALGVDLSA